MSSSNLTSLMIKNEDFNPLELKRDLLKFKVKEKKSKIIYGIIAFIIFSFLLILTYKVFIQDSSTIIIEKNEQNEEQKQEYFNLPKDPEFKKFYENYPFSLKINENGIIDFDKSSLDNTSPSKLIFLKEDYYQFNKLEIDQESKNSNSENFELAVAGNYKFLFHCDMKYKSKVEEVKKQKIKTLFIVVKKKICSLSLKRSDIEINNSFKTKIEEIANDESYTDEEKALKLDKLFNEYGYFIPLKISIGGYFYQEVNKIENENLLNKIKELDSNIKLKFGEIANLNATAQYNTIYENFIKNLFSNEKVEIIGGDTTKKSFDEWETSLNYENAQIIEYSNIIEINSLIEDFLDKDTKNNLTNALNLVNKKYEQRKIYYEKLKEAKEFILYGYINDDKNKRNGLCNKDDLIYSELIRIKDDKLIIEDRSFEDIIVGWKIISKRNDGKNGNYYFKDPILTKRINFQFKPKTTFYVNREQIYDLEIFLIKLPK